MATKTKAASTEADLKAWPADKVERRDEEWRPIPAHHSYQASSLGRIKSPAGRILKTWLAGFGYQYVSLGKHAKGSVHGFVCEAFHGARPSGFEVGHLNGDKRDNRPCNLRWVTKAENEAHKRDHGTWRRQGRPGERHHKAKLTDDMVKQMRSEFTGRRGEKTSMAAKYGVNPATVGRVVTGKAWSHV